MGEIVPGLDASNINSVILAIFVLWLLLFISKSWWPDKVARSDKQQELDHEIRLAEIEADKARDKDLSAKLQTIHESNLALHALMSDFLTNNISHLLEERKDQLPLNALRELVDTGVFKYRHDDNR